jgi:hypothetical protein
LALFAFEMSAPKTGRAPTRNAQPIAAVRLKDDFDEGDSVFIDVALYFFG